MKNWKSLMITAAMLAVMSSVQSVHAQSPQPPPSSAQSSPSSATPADKSEPPASVGGKGLKPKSTPFPVHKRGFAAAATPPAYAGGSDTIAACMATAVDLEKTRGLAAALEDENRALKERLETGKHLADLSSELNETRKK